MAEEEKKNKCRNSVLVALEQIGEACGPKAGAYKAIAEDMIVYVPEEAIKEMGYSPHSPETEEERKKAIEACMKGDWAKSWARKIVGSEAPEEVVERAAKKACEGLFM